MTSATITKKAKATTSKHHPRARITRSEYHNRMYYDVYLYIPADFESDDSDEKDRIRNCWNKNEAKLIPEDYKWSWQVKELHKYHRTLYHIHEMSLAIKTNGENEIMIRLRDAKNIPMLWNIYKSSFLTSRLSLQMMFITNPTYLQVV